MKTLTALCLGVATLTILGMGFSFVLASFSFDDEFNSTLATNILDTSLWSVNSNTSSGFSSVIERNNFVELHQNTNLSRFPYVYSNINPFPSEDYTLDLSWQYTQVTGAGTGIVLTDTLPQNGSNPPSSFNITIWQDSTNKMRVSTSMVANTGTVYQTSTSNTSSHTLTVQKAASIYQISVDSQLVYTSSAITDNFKYIWFGNPVLVGGAVSSWTEFKIDYIRVTDNSPSPSPSSTSSPSPTLTPIPSSTPSPSPTPTPQVLSATGTTVASQTQGYADSLNVWSASQDLGNNLSGTAASLIFRTLTSAVLDFTANNTRIYDITNNYSFINGCNSGSSPTDGLTISTAGVPSGYQDVAIDFSCRGYNFIPGHSYLLNISNANECTGCLKLAAHISTNGDYFTAGGLKYSFDNQNCYNPISLYVTNCHTWTTPQDDLYFILSSTTPDIANPVIFIPGIGGSELTLSSNLDWSKDNGHGGIFSHSYPAGEKVWVNQNEAIKPGDDDYFDILKLKSDGVTPEASLNLNGSLTPFGYSEVDDFFASLGYTKGVNYFTFPYDWRFDVSNTTTALDSLIDQAKQKSGKTQVNLVAHSLGGLVARNYIFDPTRAAKVNKLIELGVPHLGTPDSLKAIMYGHPLGKPLLNIFNIGINALEVKDFSQNSPSVFQLLPSLKYFAFYDNSNPNKLWPFKDDRDIDQNGAVGPLGYTQTRDLLFNLGFNQTVFNLAENFHALIESQLAHSNGVKLYEIAGSGQPTLGQIRESWLVSWPINLVPKKDETFINGDDTVPLYSATLKSDTLDLSADAQVYFVEQRHEDLPKKDGAAMQTVKEILSDISPTLASNQRSSLEGTQISADSNTNLDLYDSSGNHTGLDSNGNPETNITDTFYDSLDDTKHAFVKRSAGKVTVKITSSQSTKVKIKLKHYSSDSVDKTTTYSSVPVDSNSNLTFVIDPTTSDSPDLDLDGQTIPPISEAAGDNSLDQTPPQTSIQLSGFQDSLSVYRTPVTITLTPQDSGAGLLKTEFSLDNGQTVQDYTRPFFFSQNGTTTIQFFSTDLAGNQEQPQTLTFTLSITPSGDGGSSSSTSITAAISSSVPSSYSVAPVNLNTSLPNNSNIPNNSNLNSPQVLGATKQTLPRSIQSANITPLDIAASMVVLITPLTSAFFSFVSSGGLPFKKPR